MRLNAKAREGLLMRWGLVPFFCKGIAPRYSTINVTIEKVESGPCWRGPWSRAQRCMLPAVGFYEWHVLADGSKQPYFITTMPPNTLMAEIHNAKKRMPTYFPPTTLTRGCRARKNRHIKCLNRIQLV